MLDLPLYVPLTFGMVVILTLLLFHTALVRAVGVRRAVAITAGLLLWTVAQSLVTLRGFYQENLDTLPPRFAWVIGPPLVIIAGLLLLPNGRRLVDQLSMVSLTYLHTVRIPVEIVLYWLYLHQTIPQLMTFAGQNFDIFAGITAPFVAYLGIRRGQLNRTVLIIWNLAALALLLFIVINAILSAPTPLQRLAFNQPNVAIFYFPFILLPAVVVPIVLFSHLACLRQLWFQSTSKDLGRQAGQATLR